MSRKRKAPTMQEHEQIADAIRRAERDLLELVRLVSPHCTKNLTNRVVKAIRLIGWLRSDLDNMVSSDYPYIHGTREECVGEVEAGN